MTDFEIDDLAPLIGEAMEEWQVPGLALAVVRAGEPALIKTFGLRDAEAGLPVTSETQFNLASVTKSFTALGLCMLADEGALDWRKPVRDYIPEFRLHDDVTSDRATVRDLLTHQIGLPGHDEVYWSSDRSREEMLAAMRYLEPSADFRATFQYSNLSYMVAGMVAERISGRTWEDFTRERIFTPLTMTNTTCGVEALRQSRDAAQPYISQADAPGILKCKRVPMMPVTLAPAGDISASIADMTNYLRFYLEDGRCDGRQLLSPTALRSMQRPIIFSADSVVEEFDDSHYGLGLGVDRYRGERMVDHSGGWIGWGTRMALLPARRCGVVVLTNHSFCPILDVASWGVVDRLCGKTPVAWLDRHRKSKAESVAQEIANRERQSARSPKGRPSRPPAAFAGAYEHPGYGRIEIEVVDDELTWRFGDRAEPLSHFHYDTFRTPEDPMCEGRPSSLMPITFLYDLTGEIDRLSAPFEPMVADITFKRVADGSALNLDFRRKCLGTYEVDAIEHVVALDADANLTLSARGGPAKILTPCRDQSFTLAEARNWRLTFVQSEAGEVDEFTITYSRGEYTVRRWSPLSTAAGDPTTD